GDLGGGAHARRLAGHDRAWPRRDCQCELDYGAVARWGWAHALSGGESVRVEVFALTGRRSARKRRTCDVRIARKYGERVLERQRHGKGVRGRTAWTRNVSGARC